MAFKSNSVPEFVQQHSYAAEIPGLDLTDGVTFARRAPSVFTGATAKPWTSVDPGDTTAAMAIWQSNANADWSTIFALRGLIALLNCASPGFSAFYGDTNYATEWNHSGQTPVNLIDLGPLSGSGLTITADYTGESPLTTAGGVQLPCWLDLSYSKLSGRIFGIVYAITDTPNEGESGGGVLTLYLIRPIGNRALEASGGTIGAQLLGYTGAAMETWSAIGPTSDPRVELEKLINAYPWLLEVQTVGDPGSKLLTRVPGEGHPSLNSLVYGVRQATGNNFKERDYHQSGAFSGGWKKAVHTTTGGVTTLSSAFGFERLRSPGSGYGPAGNLRASNAIGWANMAADSDTDPAGRGAASLLRGLSSVDLYSHARNGKSGPWLFASTWLGAAGITTAAGVQQFPDFWIENGHFDSQGQTVEHGSEADVAGRKLRIVHGLTGTKAAAEKALPTIGAVTLGGYEFLEEGYEVAGANVKAHLAHPLVNVAIDAGTGIEDDITQRRGAGMTVMITGDTDDVGWSNWGCPLAVSGQGGRGLEAGHCLVVLAGEGIPDHLVGCLLPVVRAEAGVGNTDANWTGDILDSGIAGQPADYATFADKMDCVWLWRDGSDTFGQLVVNYALGGPNPASMTFGVVRGARICNVHGVYPVVAGTLGTAIEVIAWLPDGTILLAPGDDAALAVDCEQYLEQVPLSVSGDPILKAAEAIFENGHDFTFTPVGSADPTVWAVEIRKARAAYDPQIALEEAYPGEWWETDGPYLYIYTVVPSGGSVFAAGVHVAPAFYSESQYEIVTALKYYNPATAIYSKELDRCLVPGSGVTDAFVNVSVDTPSLVVKTYDATMTETSSTTDTSPDLAVEVFGVKTDGGVTTYENVDCGDALGAALADGVSTEVPATGLVSMYVDRCQEFDSFMPRFMPVGFSPDPGTMPGISFMKALVARCYSDNYAWSGTEWTGSATTKYLTYSNPALVLGHVEYDAGALEIPAACRV